MASSPRPTTLLADDHAVFLEGLTNVLGSHCKIVGSVNNGLDLVKAAEALNPEIIVSDVSMPVLGGLEAIRQLRSRASRSKVVVLSMHNDKEFAEEALRAGARGYVLKTSPSTELVNAIQQVVAGKIYVTTNITKGDIFEFEQIQKNPHKEIRALTEREKEVLQLIAEGKALKEIAGLLNVAMRTVVFHKSNLMEKTGLHTTAELTQYALRKRFITLES